MFRQTFPLIEVDHVLRVWIMWIMVKRRKVQWYGHVSRLSGLTKTILQATVQGEQKTRQTEEEVGRQHQGIDRPGVWQVPEGSGEQGKNGGNWLQNHLWCPNDPRS